MLTQATFPGWMELPSLIKDASLYRRPPQKATTEHNAENNTPWWAQTQWTHLHQSSCFYSPGNITKNRWKDCKSQNASMSSMTVFHKNQCTNKTRAIMTLTDMLMWTGKVTWVTSLRQRIIGSQWYWKKENSLPYWLSSVEWSALRVHIHTQTKMHSACCIYLYLCTYILTYIHTYM